MIKHKFTYLKFFGLALVSGLIFTSCEREISDAAVPATFPTTAEVFTDNPVGLTDQFFESNNPAEGYNTEDVFDVVDDEAYLGTSSIRVDVPSSDNPNGFLAGGIFRDRGEGRDLSGYDALTFWAKASTTATLARVGFGNDFEEDKFSVARTGIELTTSWKKYVVPIPDASRLTQERGLFSFIAAPFDVLGDGPNGNEIGWTMWLDEIKYEKLGTLGQERPNIFNGQDLEAETFNGATIQTTGITYTVNSSNGQDITVLPSTNYFIFESSNPGVATVSDSGEISVLTDGEATISAKLGNLDAQGSLTLISIGDFENAPDPTLPEEEVLSIYSDFYSNYPDLNVGAFNNEGINIETQIFGGNEFILYQNLAFVGIGWNGVIDASGFSHIHLDVQRISPGSSFIVELLDYGPDGENNGFGDGSAGGFNATSQMITDEWVPLDIPLNSFTLPTGGGGSGNPNVSNLGNLILVSNPGEFLIDNIYFY